MPIHTARLKRVTQRLPWAGFISYGWPYLALKATTRPRQKKPLIVFKFANTVICKRTIQSNTTIHHEKKGTFIWLCSCFLTAARLFLNYFVSSFSSRFTFFTFFTFCWNSFIFVHNLLLDLTQSWSGPSGTTWEPWPAPTWPSWPSGSPWMALLKTV